MKKIYRLTILLLLIAIIVSFSYRIDLNRPQRERVGELAYFPSGFIIRTLAVGNQAMLADLIWLRFIQYYGEHRMTDLQFEYMYHILDILTTLDPYFVHAYNLGALMLTHDAKRPDQAFKLLKKIIHNTPEEWRAYFMYGFINYAFIGDYKTALEYIRLSSQQPKVGDMPKRWAAYIAMRKTNDPRTAWFLWRDLYDRTKDPIEKGIAEMYLKDIAMDIAILGMDSLVQVYRQRYGSDPATISDLVQRGLMGELPVEPHGEKYYIKGGKVHSTYQLKLEKAHLKQIR